MLLETNLGDVFMTVFLYVLGIGLGIAFVIWVLIQAGVIYFGKYRKVKGYAKDAYKIANWAYDRVTNAKRVINERERK